MFVCHEYFWRGCFAPSWLVLPGATAFPPTHPLDMPLFITAELSGKTDLERAREDMIVDCLDDAISPFLHPGHVMNPDVQARVCRSQQQIQCGL